MTTRPDWTDLPNGERLHKTTVQSRVSLGWSEERATSTPLLKKRPKSIAAAARAGTLHPTYVQMRMRELDETFEEASEYVRIHGTAGLSPARKG